MAERSPSRSSRSSRWSAVEVDEAAIALMLELGGLAAPEEICGLLMPAPSGSTPEAVVARVIPLPNRAPPEDQTHACLVTKEDVLAGVRRWLDALPPEDSPPPDARLDFLVWHTHPAGGVGPSREDLRNRIPGLGGLVVTLPAGPALRY